MSITTSQKLSHATIIPLIGGSAIGVAETFKSLPDYHLSYSGFDYHESFIENYWPSVPRYTIDAKGFNESKIHYVDSVNSVCPCAGLSSLSPTSSPESKMNDWLYESSEYVLNTVKPRVLWGENAPALSTNKGRPVAERLAEIGRKYNYSYSMMKTNTFEHGIPQHRQRTFFFFWKSKQAPILGYHNQKPVSLIDYLKQVPKDAAHQDVLIINQKPSKYPEYKFLMEKRKYASHEAMQKAIGYNPLLNEIIRIETLEVYLDWLRNQKQTKVIEKSIKKVLHIQKKFSQDLGYMDSSPIVAYTHTNAIIARTTYRLIHPTEDRFYTVRELMHMMGIPHDFELMDFKNLNVICQNVPTVTTRDMSKEVKRFLENDPSMLYAAGNFVVQDNSANSILETRMIWD